MEKTFSFIFRSQFIPPLLIKVIPASVTRHRFDSTMSEEPLRLESIKELGIVDSELARKLYDILNGVLQQNSSTEPAVAVNQINDLVPSRQAGDTEATYGKSVEGFLWTFWELVLSIAKLAPHGHSSKTKVVHIVENLSRVSLTTTTIWGVRIHIVESKPNNTNDTKFRKKAVSGKICLCWALA